MSEISESSFQPFRIEDRETLMPYFNGSALGLCEYSFAVQFCWHPFNRSMWAIMDGMLVIRFTVDGQDRFVCPVGDGDRRQVIDRLMNWQSGRGFAPRIDFVPASLACDVPGNGLSAVHDPANDDYIYVADELANLPGRSFSQKRNHISALSRASEWSVRKVQPGSEAFDHCNFVRTWADGRGTAPGSFMAFEPEAMNRALNFAGPLGLDVFELIIDGACSGISICERTSPDTYTVHFEKSLPDVRGAYQAICSGVAAMAPPECVYINREQDLGVDGLRKTKRSWNPVRMEECLTIFPADIRPSGDC